MRSVSCMMRIEAWKFVPFLFMRTPCMHDPMFFNCVAPPFPVHETAGVPHLTSRGSSCSPCIIAEIARKMANKAHGPCMTCIKKRNEFCSSCSALGIHHTFYARNGTHAKTAIQHLVTRTT
ncbi:hypothetical protein EAG_07265 [Camponotus floridanus]|uniref:Uncharacterized protein n=1 Tax=Camponotus floridanus TaxID=104421 RepID=E2AQS2_CAMFO|nr:hypothetical protein EAG_07265 [Camponotus floridanus]